MQGTTAFFKRRTSKRSRLFIYLLLCVILVYTDTRFNYLEMIRSGVSLVLYPLRTIALFPVKLTNDLASFLVTTTELRAENSLLREAAFLSEERLLVKDALIIENKNLRELLGLTTRINPVQMVAEIIYHSRDPFFREIIIDRGSQHGVLVGSPAVDAEGVVGQIVRVYPWTSEISLVTDRDHPTPVQISRNGLRAILFGVGYDTSLEIRFMPVDADVKQGDLLATSGIGGVYPANLPVGVVTEVDRDDSYPFAKISVRPIANIGKHRQVLLLTKDQLFPVTPHKGSIKNDE